MKSIYLVARYNLCITFIIICNVVHLNAQQTDFHIEGSFHAISFKIQRDGDTVFSLPQQFIVPNTEEVRIDSFLLKPDIDYQLQARYGVLSIRDTIIKIILQDTVLHELKISYQALPIIFKNKYQHREPTLHIDSSNVEKPQISRPGSSFTVDDLFGSKLQKSGSIVRGFTIGSNRDLSLNSGFRMQMSGNLIDDLDVIATLTDENSPIQPEGTTQTLQEVDKVFIELRSSDFSATMGDIDLNIDGNEFGNLNRKMSGAKGYAVYRLGNLNADILLSGAVTRGKYTTNQFLGVDGVQGPYRLVGENNNRAIIVIAGTERVYINGEKMSRGENNDYVIDYSTAEITFTSRRLISRGSRVVVDFEFSDRQYNRNLWGVKTGLNLFNNRWAINSTFIHEGDNENSPIDVTLSDEDKEILKNAGGDRLKAVRSGVELVGAGKGQYIAFDSLMVVDGKDTLFRIYKFASTDTIKAVYSINFTFIGFGSGSYKKISVSQYEFVGINQGGYEPIRFLPMPQSHSLFDVDINGKPTDNLSLVGEYALSGFNPNRFSTSRSTQLDGSAYRGRLHFSPKDIKVGAINIGSFDIVISERFVGKDFLAMDRINDVEYERKWNLTDTLKQNENALEGNITFTPLNTLTFNGGIGRLSKGDQMSSDRYSLNIQSMFEELPNINYKFENIKTRDTSFNLDADWIRQSGNVKYRSGFFAPRMKISHEYLANNGIVVDSMKQGSYRWSEFVPGMTIDNNKNFSISTDIGWQTDDSLSGGSLVRASNIFLQNYSVNWSPSSLFSTRLDLGFNQRKFTKTFQQRKNDDINALLLRWQTKANPWERAVESDWFYEVSTGRSSKLERLFQRVPKGNGNYIYLGDLNNNHIIDQQDFQLSRFDGEYIAVTLPSDELIPVIDVKASTRVRLNPGRLISQDGWFGKGLSTLSSETYLRVEEKSRETDKKKIYFLQFGYFLKDATTIIGSNLIIQDLYFLENNPSFNLRYRYTQRLGLTEYAQSIERTYMHENSLRVRWELVKEISNQSEYTQKVDILTASQDNQRSREISSQAISSDWSYRPMQEFELGFKFQFGNAANFDTSRADINDQSIRLVYALIEQGQVRAEFIREEVLMQRIGNVVPFELTNGRLSGKSWIWNVNFDYRIFTYIQMSLNYEGRSEGGREAVHIGKAEVRAFF